MDRRLAITAGGLLGIASIAGGVYWSHGQYREKEALARARAGWQALIDLPFAQLGTTNSVRLRDLPGRRIVLNFWATWCAPCREEMPDFQRWHRELSSRGVQWVGIAIDNAQKVKAFCNELGITYPILIADYATLSKLPDLGNVRGALPFSAILRGPTPVPPTFLGKLPRSFVDQHA